MAPGLKDDWKEYNFAPGGQIREDSAITLKQYMKSLSEGGKAPELKFYKEYRDIVTKLKDLVEVQFI